MPWHFLQTDPTLFVVANNMFPDPMAIFPANLGAWSVTLPALPPLELTLQGFTFDGYPLAPAPGMTNAVSLAIF